MSESIVQLQKEFVNFRLGQFIHFNSATAQFCDSKVVDWEYNVENKGEKRKYPFDPKTWNPYKLDCNQWAEASEKLGVKFAALTAKHHEGFCLWYTETTSHCVKNATYKVDVVQQYLNAYRKRGIVAGLYFSMLDLTHEIGKRKCTKEDLEFTKQQLRELLTNYGEIPFIIVDGWHASWGGPTYEDMSFEQMNSFVKSIQPNCLLINHSCETSLEHTEIVFYENAAGQNPKNKFIGPGCAGNIITKHWFWNAGDESRRLKSARRTAKKIEKMNKKNISFLLNLSPNKYGLVDENMIKRFEEIGKLVKPFEDIDVLPEGWLYE